jgi:hypothetical protein
MKAQIKEIITKMEYIVNLTTKEYIACDNLEERDRKLKNLLKRLDEKKAINRGDIGYSRWNRDDNIIIAPNELIKYVKKYYSEIPPF